METVNPNGAKPYKMKGHTLPGINTKIDANPTNVAAEGLAGSSALQLTRIDVFDKEGGEGNVQGSGTSSDPTTLGARNVDIPVEYNTNPVRAIYTEEEEKVNPEDEERFGPNMPM